MGKKTRISEQDTESPYKHGLIISQHKIKNKTPKKSSKQTPVTDLSLQISD